MAKNLSREHIQILYSKNPKSEIFEEFIKIAFLNRQNILDSTFNDLKLYYIFRKGVVSMIKTRYESRSMLCEIINKIVFVE